MQVAPTPPQPHVSCAEHIEFGKSQHGVVKAKTLHEARPAKLSTTITSHAITSSEPHNPSSRSTKEEVGTPLGGQVLQPPEPPQAATEAQQGYTG